MAQPFLNLGPVQAGGVRDEDEFEELKMAERADVDDFADGFDEIGCEGGLAIAAERDVVKLQQFCRQIVINGMLAQFARVDEFEGPLQFGGHHVRVEPGLPHGQLAVHLAIDAVEITLAVGVQVHADGETAGAGREHDINKAVVEEIAGAAEGSLAGNRGRAGAAPFLFRRLHNGDWLGR